MPEEETVTIPKKLFEQLNTDSAILNALYAAGIDNTEAYAEGMRIYWEETGDLD